MKKAAKPEELVKALNLAALKQKWQIVPCVATTGEGLREAMQCLADMDAQQH